ncbi:unnamed protein product, partial [Effrenium voratum]
AMARPGALLLGAIAAALWLRTTRESFSFVNGAPRSVLRAPAVGMQSEKVDKIVDSMKELTLLEASELVKAIEETFGVDASASAGAVVMAAPGGGGGEEEAAPEKTEFDLVLKEVPKEKKIAVIKAIRSITGLGLKDAKAQADNPGKVLEGKPKDVCEDAKKQLEEAGAKADIERPMVPLFGAWGAEAEGEAQSDKEKSAPPEKPALPKEEPVLLASAKAQEPSTADAKVAKEAANGSFPPKVREKKASRSVEQLPPASVYGFDGGLKEESRGKAIALRLEPLKEGLPEYEKVLGEQKQAVSIGTNRGKVDVAVRDEAVSKKHLSLSLVGIKGELALCVLDHSTNGSFLNGNRLPDKNKRYRIRSGDKLTLKSPDIEPDYGWKVDFGNTVAYFSRA